MVLLISISDNSYTDTFRLNSIYVYMDTIYFWLKVKIIMVFLDSEKHHMSKVNLQDKLQTFDDYWNPRIVGELNGQQVKLVKFKGEFVWHHHENEDELFLVLEGSFEMHYRDKVVKLNKGEFIIVPKGIEHRPIAKDEVSVLLFEPKNTLNTGNIVNELTKNNLDRIDK